MKELLAQASNLLLAPDLSSPPKVLARVELILICSEPVYNYGAGGLSSTREVSDMRVLCGHAALRDMAEKLIELANEAKALEVVMNSALVGALEEDTNG